MIPGRGPGRFREVSQHGRHRTELLRVRPEVSLGAARRQPPLASVRRPHAAATARTRGLPVGGRRRLEVDTAPEDHGRGVGGLKRPGSDAVSGSGEEPLSEEGVNQLGVERHVDPRVQAGVEGEQPEEPIQGAD